MDQDEQPAAPADEERPPEPGHSRARGGPTAAGGTYIVGEDGPELVAPPKPDREVRITDSIAVADAPRPGQ